jgi:tryptophan 2,3-dioxygenase
VAVGIEPRPMMKGSDADRDAAVRLYDGQPGVDFDGTSNPYNNYQSIDLLLSLQHLRSDGYDEHCFYLMGQVKELLSRQYRWRHFVSVQRIIGLKPGTGGSAGVGWLQHVTSHRFFPELWSIRTML